MVYKRLRGLVLDEIPKKKTTAYPSTSESAKRPGLEPKNLDEMPKKKTTAYPSTSESAKRLGLEPKDPNEIPK